MHTTSALGSAHNPAPNAAPHNPRHCTAPFQKQVQYGYVNLEEIFRDSTNLSIGSLAGLLVAKIAATSVCVGGGLVGGLFAPSLFLGALVGDMMGHFFLTSGGVVDGTSYVVVGAAAVLGAACRAPLTAMALMVEITRDTGLLVPLLAAIGMSSLVTDYLEGAFSKKVEAFLVEMYLREKAMFWGAAAAESLLASQTATSSASGNTVESVMSTTTNMYVRHTLPLEQARAAMRERKTGAAVVVDDNFKVGSVGARAGWLAVGSWVGRRLGGCGSWWWTTAEGAQMRWHI